MSQNPWTLGATKEVDTSTVNTEVINHTIINTEETDIRPFIPPCHRDIPWVLLYEKYQIDNLWKEDQGLETTGHVVGFALDQFFFLHALEKHLSYPVHATPWFFSPFISANSHKGAVNRGNRSIGPQSIFVISVKDIFDEYPAFRTDERPYIYSLQKLVTQFKIPASKFKHRPYWEDEYLILKRVPAKAIIRIFDPKSYDECKSTRSAHIPNR